MKQHSTNYQNTFIQVASDCPVRLGEIPPTKNGTKSIAWLQYEMIASSPYRYTSDEVLFELYALKNNIPPESYPEAQMKFFSKGQPCFRASPLTKRYGWGVHSDSGGKIALVGCETQAYEDLSNDAQLKVVKAMKSSKI